MAKDSWPLMEWFATLPNNNRTWMVCRNGHLWCVEIPMAWELAGMAPLFDSRRRVRERVQRVQSCATCKMLKQAGAKSLRGMRSVCPDWTGIIKARELLDGTIEHHHPEQVAQVYSEDNVKAWKALMAYVSITYRREEREFRAVR